MKFKLIIFPAIEKGSHYKAFMFKTKEEMMAAKNCAADLLLFLQDDIRVMADFSNIFDCREFINGEWEDFDEIWNIF